MSDDSTERALRKQLLLMRAATERAQMVGVIDAARQSATFFKGGVSGLALTQSLPLMLGLLKRAPLAGSVLSLLWSGARRPLLRYTVLAAGSALLAWKGYQWWVDRAAQPSKQPDDVDAAQA